MRLATVNDPVLGPSSVLPLRRTGSLLLVTGLFIAMVIAGLIVLFVWLFVPGSRVDPGMIVFVGFAGPLVALIALPNQLKTLLFSPCYAIVGTNGFAAFGLEPILWRDVAGIQVRTYHGKPIGLVVALARPRRLSLTGWINNGFGLLNRASAPYLFYLPKGSAPLPIEQLYAMFVGQLEAYRSRAA